MVQYLAYPGNSLRLDQRAGFSLPGLDVLAKTPRGVSYGDFKLDPDWDPLRTDPRFNELLAELAPKD